MVEKKWLALVCVSLFALAAVACGGGSKSNSGGTGVTVVAAGDAGNGTPGSGPFQPAVDANGTPIATLVANATPSGSPVSGNELASLYSNFAKLKSFKATITTTGGTSPDQTITIEEVLPDKVHLTVSSKAAAVPQETICISGTVYNKGVDGKWVKVPPPATPPPTPVADNKDCGFDPATIANSLKSTTDTGFTKGGTDTVNGKKCQLYTRIAANGVSSEYCVADGLPQRTVDKAGQQSSIAIFTYGGNIDISPPI